MFLEFADRHQKYKVRNFYLIISFIFKETFMTTNQPIAIGVGQTRKFDELLGGQPQDFSFTINNDASVSNPTNFNVLLRGLRQDADLELYRDINGNGRIDTADVLVAQSSQKGMTFDESIQTRLTLPGTYIARVKNASNASTPFSLVLSNTGKAASNLLPLGTQLGTLTQNPATRENTFSVTNTANTYRFTMAEAGNFNAALSGLPPQAKANIRLIRDTNNNGVVDQGELLATSVNPNVGGNQGITVRNLVAGNYILQTNLESRTNNAPTNYRLQLSNSDTAANNLLGDNYYFGISRLFGTSDTLNAEGRATATAQFKLENPSNSFNASIRKTDFSAEIEMRLVRDANNNGVVDKDDVIVRSRRTSQEGGTIHARGLPAGTYFLQKTLVRGERSNYDLNMSNSNAPMSNLMTPELDIKELKSRYIRSNTLNLNNTNNTYRFTMETAGNFNAVLSGLEPGSQIGMRLLRDNSRGIVNENSVVVGEVETNSTQNWQTATPSTSRPEDAIVAWDFRDGTIHVRSLAAGDYILQTYHRGLPRLGHSQEQKYSLRMSNTGLQPIGDLFPQKWSTLVLRNDGRYDTTGKVTPNQSIETYQINQTEVGNFNASLSNIPAGANVDMFLLRDANNNGIADAGDFIVGSSKNANADEAINVRSLAAGNYFLQVAYGAGSTQDSASYRLNISNTGSNPSDLLPVERHLGILDLPLPGGSQPKTHTGSLNDRNTSDTIRFSVAGNRNTRVSLTGLSANADLRLIEDRNNNGRIDPDEIIQVSTSFGTTSETIGRPLTAGNYFAQVFLPAAGNTNYTLTVS
jgi:hypothetical protein